MGKSLKDWMAENGKRPADLQRAVGCSRANASRLARGLHQPSKALGDRIIAWTNGEVDWNSLMKRPA